MRTPSKRHQTFARSYMHLCLCSAVGWASPPSPGGGGGGCPPPNPRILSPVFKKQTRIPSKVDQQLGKMQHVPIVHICKCLKQTYHCSRRCMFPFWSILCKHIGVHPRPIPPALCNHRMFSASPMSCVLQTHTGVPAHPPPPASLKRRTGLGKSFQ